MKTINKIDKNSPQRSSNTIEGLLGDALMEEGEERAVLLPRQIAQLRLETTGKRKAHQDQLTPADTQAKDETEKIGENAEDKINDLAGQIDQIKIHIKEKQKEFEEQIDKVKAEAKEALDQQKADSDSLLKNKEKNYDGLIAKLKFVAKDKVRKLNDHIDQIKSDAENKQTANINEIAAITAEKEEAIAVIKNECEESIREVKANAFKDKTSQKEIAGSRAAEIVAVEMASAEETVTKLRTQAEIDAQKKGQVEERVKFLIAKIAQLEAEAVGKRKQHEGQISKIKSEAYLAIAKQKKEAESRIKAKEKDHRNQILRLKVEKEKLVKIGISDAMQKMAKSSPTLPDKGSLKISAISSNDIMQKPVWGSADDSVQQTLSKMEQHGASHIMIGSDGILEGIVSKYDLNGAISPFLRPEFAKWRRPVDDASLQIKVKWIMTKPVQIVRSKTPLAVIIGKMSQFSVHALPVLSEQGKTLGVVTDDDVFKEILRLKTGSIVSDSNKSTNQKSAIPIVSNRRDSSKKSNKPSLAKL